MMIKTILLIMMKRSIFLDQEEAKDEGILGSTPLRGIMMKRSMTLDQGKAKDERRLVTTLLEEIRCGGRL